MGKGAKPQVYGEPIDGRRKLNQNPSDGTPKIET